MMRAIIAPPILDLSIRLNRFDLYFFLWLTKGDNQENIILFRNTQRFPQFFSLNGTDHASA